ncbi:hypothetical protein C4D60_Mb06t31720 [Musa balbisiana]|uniref:Uncharacterized protein n=1 Tax=Musa balbisiana TaxID=52838 RepID=A0A4S8IUK9_MUSBA|nr:hypothetical protein C4D60_Mb06t31720 [Musa balbisiana]
MAERKKVRRGLAGRCAALVKEQRARIYILRRCATLLLCCSTVLGLGLSAPALQAQRWGLACTLAGLAADCTLLCLLVFVLSPCDSDMDQMASCILYKHCC